MEFEGIKVETVDRGVLVRTLTGEEFIFSPKEIEYIYTQANKHTNKE